jgi:DNA-binding transcriptional LysR family regulator
MPELRQYRYLVEVVRRGTFTAAADALHVTQSTLSEQIIQLERECGCQLLNRKRLGVTLTPAGEYVLPRAHELVQRARELQLGVLAFRREGLDPLRIGATVAPHRTWLPQATAHFSRLEPQVRTHSENVTPDEVAAGLASSRFDLGIVPRDPLDPDLGPSFAGMRCEVLVEEDLVVISSYDHYLADVAEVRAVDLATVPLVTYRPDSTLRRIVARIYEQLDLSPTLAAQTSSIEHMWRLVSAGAGIALMPRSIAWAGQVNGLRAVELPPEVAARRQLVALWPAEHPHSEALAKLVRVLAAHAAEMHREALLATRERSLALQLLPDGGSGVEAAAL